MPETMRESRHDEVALADWDGAVISTLAQLAAMNTMHRALDDGVPLG